MIRLPQIYVPLLFLPQMAMASGIPPGFEEFDQVYIAPPPEFDFIEFMVNLNKNCILGVLQLIHQVGIFNDGAGLAIIFWAVILKLMTSPFYENALKYPTQMEKAIQSVIEAELDQDDEQNANGSTEGP